MNMRPRSTENERTTEFQKSSVFGITMDGIRGKFKGKNRDRASTVTTDDEDNLDCMEDDYSIYEFDPDRNNKMCQNRRDIQFVRYVQSIIDQAWFNNVLTVTILLNILALFLEVMNNETKMHTIILSENPEQLRWSFLYLFNYDEEDFTNIIKIMDSIFISVYLVEFILKFYCEPIDYWYTKSNLLDFFILAISFLQMSFTQNDVAQNSAAGSVKVVKMTMNVKIIKVLRALRALRTIKTIWYIRGAQVILKSIIRAQKKSLASVGPMILFFMFIFAILLFTTIYYQIGIQGVAQPEVENCWGCFMACFCSLFMIITVDGWYELTEAVDLQHQEDGLIHLICRLFIAVAIVFGHMMIFNLFIAINVLQVDEANTDYQEELISEREALLEAKKGRILQRQFNDVKKLRDEQDARGCSFSEMVKSFKSTLKHDDYTLAENVITDLEWMDNHRFVLEKLDDSTYKIQQLLFEYTNCLIYSQNEEVRKRLGK